MESAVHPFSKPVVFNVGYTKLERERERERKHFGCDLFNVFEM
jgi:hypothetical protein